MFISVLSSTQAAEISNLEITMTHAVLLGQKEVSAYIFKTETYELQTSYEYKFAFFLKNTSNAEITVVTKNLDPSIMIAKEGETPLARLSINKMSYHESQIIPSVSDLGLVTLRPGESAAISWEKSSFTQLKSIKVQYNPVDIYDNRFGYWTGCVTGESVEVTIPEN